MRKVFFTSLGCDKNLVDTEHMLGRLSASGYEPVSEPEEADALIVNTCCFIHDAKEESVENILQLADIKKEYGISAFIVTGCMAQLYGKEIMDTLPEVDGVVGTAGVSMIVDILDRIFAGEKVVELPDTDAPAPAEEKRIAGTGTAFAYLKIAEGCEKNCTYCIIPKLRGKYRSVPMEELVSEAGKLSETADEIILVAQETTLYGTDLYGRKSLHTLLEKLCAIDAVKWIRVLYCYPEEIYPELVEVIAREPKICAYLDIPIQHCSDRILKKMGRRTTRAQIEETIGFLRGKIPDITLRTSLITGFPGETDEEHAELLDFVERMRFDRLGVFTYSREEGTPAYSFKDQIGEETKKARQEELMLAQQRIAFEKNDALIGEIKEVFIEGYIPEDDIYIGRTRADAPQVDGYIFVSSGRELNSGDIVLCRVTGAAEYDLTGEIIDESAE